jgi:hypothetical protein
MSGFRFVAAGLVLAAGLSLSACETDDYGDGGYGYGGGYGGVSVGYSDWDPYYGGFRADPYWGWYGDYYYPGTGYYVYDRYNRRHRWNDSQRGYWQGRSRNWHDSHRDMRPMWRDYRGARGDDGRGRGRHYDGDRGGRDHDHDRR